MKREILGIILITVLILSGCGRQERVESKNMEQIYADSGIPVKVMEIDPRKFSQELPFTAVITGLRQANASSMIGGIVEQIHVKVGDLVKKDQVLFEFPEDTPAGQLAQAKSSYELAKATFERMENLFEVGGISQQELESVETQYHVAEANLDAALQMLKVRAPISGQVTSISVRETDGVQAETVLAVISRTDEMKSRIWVTENEIYQIQTGQNATFEWNNIILEGKVTSVAMAMDLTRNAFGVDLVFSNQQNLCRSGVVGDIKILTYENETALIIPRKNVLKDENGQFVYLMKDNRAVKSYIETGYDNGSFEILAGVEAGDSIIVEGLNLVYNEAKVKIAE
jgi:membrane fusion protein, multidrug efflux system